MRFVHGDGWFADLPPGTDTTRLDRVSVVADGAADVAAEGAADVVMRGIVVARKHGWNVVSCYGLYVSAPGAHPVGARVRAHIGHADRPA